MSIRKRKPDREGTPAQRERGQFRAPVLFILGEALKLYRLFPPASAVAAWADSDTAVPPLPSCSSKPL